jgi:16S rRNA (cytosine1402-N4)-methyltransferase
MVKRQVIHSSVLLKEVVEGLALHPGEILLDGTIGGAGHSAALCRSVLGKVQVIGLDVDPNALVKATLGLKTYCTETFTLLEENFRNLDQALVSIGLPKEESVDAILLDLGWSSFQLEESGRGFSFLLEEPLLMTLGRPEETAFTARDILNSWDEEHIKNILWGYGEERYAGRIAKKIVEVRKKTPIETTADLVELIKSAVPATYRRGKIHPATKTFQAFRVAVNDELRTLQAGLEKGWRALTPKGRMAVISFHSLEDRIVKQFFQTKAKENQAKLLTKKPIVPTQEEVRQNPRSRSAKLRIIQKI